MLQSSDQENGNGNEKLSNGKVSNSKNWKAKIARYARMDAGSAKIRGTESE
jgi:hypothetical protein